MKIKKTFAFIIFAVLFCLYISPTVFAQSGYEIIIEDYADLLTEEQEALLYEQMKEVLPYGNAGVITIGSHPYSSTDILAENLYYEYFGGESGILFTIDMQKRNLYIYSDGEIYKTVTKTRANEITDDIYTDATK